MAELLKVDLADNVIGVGTKEELHKAPVLHRAFSAFLYDGNKMLIQRRAEHKYHSGGLWTNACCSHPRANETIKNAVFNRMNEEIGVACECEEYFSFVYYHKFNECLYEYEVDHVFIGNYSGEIYLNEDEAMDYKWINIDELTLDVKKNPEKYTVWFITALPRVIEIIKKKIKNDNSELADLEYRQKKTYFNHFPEVIQIELTDKCNSECIMCKHYYEENCRADDLKDGVLEKLEKFIPYCKLVLLNGYGESLISKKYTQCMDLLRKYDVKAFITTNLSVFNEQHCQDAQTVFEQINVSCHGCNKEDYEKISLGLSFETFEENLRKLTTLEKGPKVILSVVAMSCNIKSVPDMVRFAVKYGIKEVRFGRLGINSFIKNDDLDLIHYDDAAKFYFNEAEKIAAEHDVTIVYPSNFKGKIKSTESLKKQLKQIDTYKLKYDRDFQNVLKKRFDEEIKSGNFEKNPINNKNSLIKCSGICDWAAKGLYVDKNGICYPCCESKKVSYGEINNEPMKVINCDNALNLRAEFYNGILPQFCRNCPFIINNELDMLTVEKDDNLYVSSEYEIMG